MTMTKTRHLLFIQISALMLSIECVHRITAMNNYIKSANNATESNDIEMNDVDNFDRLPFYHRRHLGATRDESVNNGHNYGVLTKYNNTHLHNLEKIDVPVNRKISNFVDVVDSNRSDDQCVLRVSNASIDHFRHSVYRSSTSFAYLKLTDHRNSGVVINAGTETVGAKIWIWTFLAEEGAFEYLMWPTEYGIWSLGLLYETVIDRPMEMFLERVKGNCSNIKVGDREMDLIIATALEAPIVQLMKMGSWEREVYGPSFLCYTRRMLIASHGVYILCKHIVCPLEALKHECCNYYYNTTLHRRIMECPETLNFQYDMFWWGIPTVISIILFIYSPILIFFVAYKISNTIHAKSTVQIGSARMANVVENSDETITLTVNDDNEDYVLLLAGFDHVTFQNAIFAPCLNLWTCILGHKSNTRRRSFVFRCLRMIMPFASLIIIAIQILIDYHILYNYVIEAMSKGVPMGFRSMLGGYQKSKLNFLPYVGGPYVAIGVYLLIACALLLIPESLEATLSSCLRITSDELEGTPLAMNVRTVGMFGSVKLSHRQGYHRVYWFLMAAFFMLFNKRFWHHCILIQRERWNRACLFSFCSLFLPIYVLFCGLELITAILLYGLPIFTLGQIMVCSYDIGSGRSRGFCTRLCNIFCTTFVTYCVAWSVFMFCTIFLDATLFISRIFIFTFTGIIEFPRSAYGYMIFAFTVFYYIWDSTNEFTLMYRKLFKDTIGAAESVQRANDGEDKKLVHKIDGTKAIRKTLFEFVVEVHRPRRKYLFLAILKVMIILVILFLLIHLLLTIGTFRELHAIMHVGTALFFCALPQIAKQVCKKKQDKNKAKRFRDKLVETVRVYIEYYIYEGWGGAEEELF